MTKKHAQDTSPIAPPDFNEKSKRENLSPQSNEFAPVSAKSTSSDTTAVDELKAKLSDAQSQIERLKEKVSDNGLRQRKIGVDTKGPSSSMMQQQQSPAAPGVPIHLVAGLCLLSFVLAYLFF